MYIAMNKFKIKNGNEVAFEQVWRERDSKLEQVDGFIEFKFLKGETTPDYTIYSSFVLWQSQEAFKNWVQSDEFKQAHKKSDSNQVASMHLDHPKLECYQVVDL